MEDAGNPLIFGTVSQEQSSTPPYTALPSSGSQPRPPRQGPRKVAEAEHNTGRNEDGEMSLKRADLEMDNMGEQRSRIDDEETGSRTGDDNDERDDAMATARAGAKIGYENFIRKSIANGILIALWYARKVMDCNQQADYITRYLFSITISVVGSRMY